MVRSALFGKWERGMSSSKAMVWSKRMAAWRASGELAAAFCRARGLAYAQFVYWQRRCTLPSMPLVPVRVETPEVAAARGAEELSPNLEYGVS